jgi:subtilisin family serine protease
MVDVGVDMDHPSLDVGGDGMPLRWKGSYEGLNYTNKLIGGKNLVDPGKEPADDDSGHNTHTAITVVKNRVSDIYINKRVVVFTPLHRRRRAPGRKRPCSIGERSEACHR